MYVLWLCGMQRKYTVSMLLYLYVNMKQRPNTKYKSDYTKDLSLSVCETPGGKTSTSLQLPTGEGAPMRMEKIYNPAPRAVGCVNTEKSPRRIGQTDATQELALLA